jgi:hypothetical protein
VLSNGYIGTFEMNGAWVGGDAWPMKRLIAIPYVAADDIIMNAFSEYVNNTDLLEMSKAPRHVSLYFAASERKNVYNVLLLFCLIIFCLCICVCL